MNRELLTLLAACGSAVFALLVLAVSWAKSAASVAVEEMFRQEYDSSAIGFGDLILWVASRRTADPLLRFEEWKAHLDECRAATGRPCLPEALQILLVGTRGTLVRTVPVLPERPAVPDADFGANLLEQMFELWIDAELARRQGVLSRADVHRAVVVMPARGALEVKLNDEVDWIAAVTARGPIAAGQPVTTSDVDLDSISSLRPAGIDPNAGWTGFVTVAGHQFAAFDFRRNRLTAWTHLDRAETHLARIRSGRLRRGRGVRRLLSAVEEAVTAMELTMYDEVNLSPPKVRRVLRGAAELGNVPASASAAADFLGFLDRAGRLRRALVRRATMLGLLGDVVDLVEFAKRRVGERPARSDAA